MRVPVSNEIVAFVLFCLTAAVPVPTRAADRDASPVRTVRIGDIDVAFRIFGAGDPLVMIMGYGGSMDLWSPRLLQLLSATNRVVIFDNRGMGRSSSSDREYSVPLFSEDTLGLMKALEIDSATVLAWSLGTEIALELALSQPQRVEKLILISGTPGGRERVPPSPEVERFFESTSGSGLDWGLHFIGLLFPQQWLVTHPFVWTYFPVNATMNPPERTARQYSALTRWEGCFPRLAHISSPTLIVTGDEDAVVPPGNSLLLAAGIPAARLVRIPDGGHGVMYQYPDRVAAEIAALSKKTGS